MVGDEAVGDGAAARGRRLVSDVNVVGSAGVENCGDAGTPLASTSSWPGKAIETGSGQRVVQDHRDGVALVDAEHRAWVLERRTDQLVPLHERGVAVGRLM